MVVEASGPPPAFRPKIEPLVIEEEEDLDIPADFDDEEEEESEAEGRSREGRDGVAGVVAAVVVAIAPKP